MRPWPVLVVLLLPLVAAGPSEVRGAPSLEVTGHAAGNRLAWDYAADTPPGRIVGHLEIWRYEPDGSTSVGGAQVGGVATWELYDTSHGNAQTYIDHDPGADGGTFYFVRVVYTDGSWSPPSNPSSVDYPHCHWLYVAMPPQTEPGCLFPPPGVGPPPEATTEGA